jgi:hypothetical protein
MSRQTELTLEIGTTCLKLTAGNGALLDCLEEMRLRHLISYKRSDNQHAFIAEDAHAVAIFIDFADEFLRTVGVHTLSYLTYLIDMEQDIANHDEYDPNVRFTVVIYL